jgi:hypothetical protein
MVIVVISIKYQIINSSKLISIMSDLNSATYAASPITGSFKIREDADRAYDTLVGLGYSSDDITVIMSDQTKKTHFVHGDHDSDLGNKSLEKAGVGSAIGGTAGAIIGAIAAIGTVVALPGVGLVVAGPLLAALTGAGAGGLTGGIIGALVGSGIPKEHAEHYENSIKEGGIIIGVTPKSVSDRNIIISDWKNYQVEQLHGGETDLI